MESFVSHGSRARGAAWDIRVLETKSMFPPSDVPFCLFCLRAHYNHVLRTCYPPGDKLPFEQLHDSQRNMSSLRSDANRRRYNVWRHYTIKKAIRAFGERMAGIWNEWSMGFEWDHQLCGKYAFFILAVDISSIFHCNTVDAEKPISMFSCFGG